MSRRRGEFEHRTSIFEGAFRAWSHLGGLEPEDLEGKPASDFDPLNHPHVNDKRLLDGKKKNKGGHNDDEGGSGGNGSPSQSAGAGSGSSKKEYPYEPLPRSGLGHPFVQAILSPWLGPDADQDAIQLGLTTLRTWWQHRRKGESGSAIAALRTDKMSGVVEGYTRHFFNLAHCLVVNDNEQAPRTLMQKLKSIEKTRSKKNKKRTRDEEASKLVAMALSDAGIQGLAPGGGAESTEAVAGLDYGDPFVIGASASVTDFAMDGDGEGGGGCCSDGAAGHASAPELSLGVGGIDDSHLTPLERFHAEQQRQLGVDIDPATGLPKIDVRGKCIPGKLDLPSVVSQVSSHATQLAHRGALAAQAKASAAPGSVVTSGGGLVSAVGGQQQPVYTDPAMAAHAAAQAGQYGDPTKTPVVFVSENGDLQIAMSVDGITCAHCVKIVETVLKGCNGNKSPIEGLLDAAADRALNSVLIKIDRSSSAKRIAFESARNLAMVGYTAIAKEMDIGGGAGGGQGVDMGMLSRAFDVVATTDKADVFDWTLPCTCPDNGVLREDCSRHSQMNKGIFSAFERRQEQVQRFISGCSSLHGMPCNCGPTCKCANCDKSCQQNKEAEAAAAMALRQPGDAVDPQTMLQQIQQQRMALEQQQQQHALSGLSGSFLGGAGLPPQQLAQLMEGGGAAEMPGQRGSWQSRKMSIASEETFGRAMSGLSALSIDWENMDDFDVNVDHSAHINSDLASGGRAPIGVVAGGAAAGVDDGIMEGCAMSKGGVCTCGPSCVCVGCSIHDQATALPSFPDGGPAAGSRRSSLKKSVPLSSNGTADPSQQVSFKV